LLSVDFWRGNGAGSNNWSAASNWSGGVPANGAILNFGAIPNGGSKSSNNDLVGRTFQTIEFSDNGYQLKGNAISLTGGVSAAGSTGTNEIDLNLTLAHSEFLGAGRQNTDLIIGGSIQLNANLNHPAALSILGGPGEVDLNGSIARFGDVSFQSSGRTLVAGPGNTYQGGTTVGAGTVVLDTGGTAAPGALTIDGGRVMLSANNEIAQTSRVTVAFSGVLDLHDQSELVESLVLNNGTVVTGSGTLGVSGVVNSTGNSSITGNFALVAAGPESVIVAPAFSTLTVNAVVSGSAMLNKTGGGTLVLNVGGTYTGGTQLIAGTLALGNGGALGTGILSVYGGQLKAGGTVNNAINLLGNLVISDSSTLFLTGSIWLQGNRLVTVADTQGVFMNGSVGAGVLSKAGPGWLALTGIANVFTRVLSGMVYIATTQAPTRVYAGGILASSGNVGAVIVGTNGHLGGGPKYIGTGMLSALSLDLTPGAILEAVLANGSQGAFATEITVSGPARIAGSTLRLDVTTTPPRHRSFTLIHNTGSGPIIGTFAGLPQNSTFFVGAMLFRINYHAHGGKDVVVTRVL
jgi:autotransporter-associated beta strand protein